MPLLEADKTEGKPTIDDLQAKTETAWQRRKARRAERHGTAGAVEETETKADASAVPVEKMLGMARWVNVGSLQLRLVCPPLRKAGEIQEEIYRTWPDAFVFAAFTDTSKGIDPEAVALMWSESRRIAWEQSAATDKGEETAPVTADEVRGIMRSLMARLLAKQEEMTAICDCLWKLAHVTPGLHWPRIEDTQLPNGAQWLDDALLDNCTATDFATLINIVFDVMGGFTGAFRDRFS